VHLNVFAIKRDKHFHTHFTDNSTNVIVYSTSLVKFVFSSLKFLKQIFKD